MVTTRLTEQGDGFAAMPWPLFLLVQVLLSLLIAAVGRHRWTSLKRQHASLARRFSRAAARQSAHVRLNYASYLLPVDEMVRIAWHHGYAFTGADPGQGDKPGAHLQFDRIR